MTLERSKFTAGSLALAASGLALTLSCAAFAAQGHSRDTAPGLNRQLLPDAANHDPKGSGESRGRTVILSGLGAGEADSFLRFSNLGAHAGSAAVTLIDAETGEDVVTWDSDPIPGHGALQVALADILGDIDVEDGASFTAVVRATFNGEVQHVGWSETAGVVSDLTACRALATPRRGLGYVTGLGDSDLDGTVGLVNEGMRTRTVELVLYDAVTGDELGTWTSPDIAKHGALSVSVATLADEASTPVPDDVAALTIGVRGAGRSIALSYLEGADGGPVTDLTAGCMLKGGEHADHDDDEVEDDSGDDGGTDGDGGDTDADAS